MPLDTVLLRGAKIVPIDTARFKLLAGTDLLLRAIDQWLRGPLSNGLQSRIFLFSAFKVG
jgi:hypothetical protein